MDDGHHTDGTEGVVEIEQRAVGDVVVLSIRGDITIGERGAVRVADKVRSALHEGHDRLLLDLGHVGFVIARAWGASCRRMRPCGTGAAPSSCST